MGFGNKRIDVIIPAYHAQNTIFRTLSSIATQKILADIDVTIVNDADEIGYQKFISIFSPYMSIREIKLETNGGPGVARQYGIDNTNNNYLTFIDADDVLEGPFALKFLRQHLAEDDSAHICAGTFIEESQDRNIYVAHQMDMIWMFGKMYARPFLVQNNIRFHPTSRSNEDGGFNALIRLISDDNQIKFINDAVYVWHWRDDSITRANNCDYTCNQSFMGYAENMIYAITEANKRKADRHKVFTFIVDVMMFTYAYFMQSMYYGNRYSDQNWSYCRKVYNEVYCNVAAAVTDNVLRESYSKIMKEQYTSNHFHMVIPCMGILEFLDRLKSGKNWRD